VEHEHTELEEELHEKAHIDYDRVAIVPNPSVAALYEDALVYETGSAITSTGALTAYSGAKTGRSPLDKRIVKEPGSERDVWWGPVNKPMTPEVRTRDCLLFSLGFDCRNLHSPCGVCRLAL
jgi:phosphoenolpyruvate carboxykinase (ATP)